MLDEMANRRSKFAVMSLEFNLWRSNNLKN